ncbi:MAG: hypothetical protein ACRDKS_07050 [Actinomycetota bacterium]
MDIFRKIEQSFAAHRASRSFETAVARWRGKWPVFADLGEAEDVARACRKPGPRALKDAIHVALCVEATHTPKDELACLFLYWLFLPGLIATADELCSSDNFDEVTAELLSGFLEAVSKVSPSSTHVARHLIRGGRLRALTNLRKAEARASHEEELEVDQAGSDDPTASARVLMADALRGGVISAVEAKLLFAEREDLATTAALHELTSTAARQMKARARQKLAAWLSETSQDPLAS